MDNLFIKYHDFFRVNSVTGLKSYQKVKEILAGFDVKSNEEMCPNSKDEAASARNSGLPGLELNQQRIRDSNLKINQLV